MGENVDGDTQVGLQISLSLGQRVTWVERHESKHFSGVITGLQIEEQLHVASILLDAPIVIPSHADFREIRIYRQRVPVTELLPTAGPSLLERSLVLLSELMVLANSCIDPNRLIADEKNVLLDVNRLLEETGPLEKGSPIFRKAA